MNKQISFFIKNRDIIESLRTEQEIIDFFAENNIFIDENFIKTIKFNYNNLNNSTKLDNSQLEKVSGGVRGYVERKTGMKRSRSAESSHRNSDISLHGSRSLPGSPILSRLPDPQLPITPLASVSERSTAPTTPSTPASEELTMQTPPENLFSTLATPLKATSEKTPEPPANKRANKDSSVAFMPEDDLLLHLYSSSSPSLGSRNLNVSTPLSHSEKLTNASNQEKVPSTGIELHFERDEHGSIILDANGQPQNFDKYGNRVDYSSLTNMTDLLKLAEQYSLPVAQKLFNTGSY